MMKKKVVAGFMAATMMVSVMSTGVFAKDLDPSNEDKKMGDTQVTATVEENENKASYVIQIPDTVDFGKIQQPETEGNVYSTHDITVSCIQADNLAAGNAIERAYKNVNEIANFMLSERYFPYILFLEGSNFLTENVTVKRPDGREVTLIYNDGTLNRLDRLTAANYGMPINTNLCENRYVKCSGATIMLQAASIYTKGEGGHWNDEDMIMVMLEVARTSLKMLGSDLFSQLSKR